MFELIVIFVLVFVAPVVLLLLTAREYVNEKKR